MAKTEQGQDRTGLEIFCRGHLGMKLFGGKVKCIVKSPSINESYFLKLGGFTFIPLVPRESFFVVIGIPQWPIPVILPKDKVELRGTLDIGEIRKYVFTPSLNAEGYSTIEAFDDVEAQNSK